MAKYAVASAASAWAIGLRKLDAAALLSFAGVVSSVLIGDALKLLINQSRPIGAAKADPGMPSTHSAAYGFIFTYIGALLFKPCSSLFARALMHLIGASLAALRVVGGLHSPAQAVAGYALGVGVGAAFLHLLAHISLSYTAVVVIDGCAFIAFIASRIADQQRERAQ